MCLERSTNTRRDPGTTPAVITASAHSSIDSTSSSAFPPSRAMATSATAAAPTTTILGKRKATQSYIIHLSASDVDPDVNTDTNTHLHTDGDAESSYASDAAAGPSASKNGRPNARRTAMGGERAYRCAFEGCDKAYTKPSRLAEHARSHTGHVRSLSFLIALLFCFLLSHFL